jgi:hypothetical protein
MRRGGSQIELPRGREFAMLRPVNLMIIFYYAIA